MRLCRPLKTYLLPIITLLFMTACGGGGSSTGTTAAEQAHKALQSYIQNPAVTAPTRETYIEAGATPSDIQGVDIAMLNAYVRTLSSEDVDTVQEVELLVAAYSSNHPPQAYAGEDKRIEQGVSLQLHCQGSDTDGNETLSYAWYRGSTLLSSTAFYTVPVTLTPGAYVYTCKVTDDYLRLAADDVNISVYGNTPTPPTYTLTYSAGAHGSITGSTTQTVNKGSNGSAVNAVADSGYHFVKWDDNKTANPRTDSNVQADITVNAVFVQNTRSLSD